MSFNNPDTWQEGDGIRGSQRFKTYAPHTQLPVGTLVGVNTPNGWKIGRILSSKEPDARYPVGINFDLEKLTGIRGMVSTENMLELIDQKHD